MASGLLRNTRQDTEINETTTPFKNNTTVALNKIILTIYKFAKLTRVACLGDRMDIFPIPQDAAHTCVGRHSSSAVT